MSLVAKRYLDELGWRWKFSQIHYQVHKVYQISKQTVTKTGKGFDSLGVCDTTIARHGKVKDKGFHWLLIKQHYTQFQPLRIVHDI